jgi:methionine sulfoxide reductase heme-binding subunit
MAKMKLKFDRVIASLILCILFIYTVPFVPALAERMTLLMIGLTVVLAIMAAVKHAWTDVVLAIVIGLTFGLARLKFDQVDDLSFVFRTAAVLAFVGLHVTLFIGPWSRFTAHFRNFYKHRRHVGVATFLLALTHASLIMKIYFNYDMEQAFSSTFVFFGYTAFFILLWLALTSWDYVQKHIKNKWWGVVHTGLLVVYLGMVMYVNSVSLDITTWHNVLFGTFLVYWLAAAPWGVIRKMVKRVNGWKQLHVLVYIAYTSVIVHVWTGVVSLLEPWVQALFWTFVVAVVTSHAIGWALMIKKALKKRGGSSEVIELNGGRYHLVGQADEFEEGKGQKKQVGNQELAVFRYNNEFFGLASICPHQGGPIADGEVVNGYVECPWHKWQFSVESGGGPPGFPDCIPYYSAVVQDNSVYVNEQSTEQCKEEDGHTTFQQS